MDAPICLLEYVSKMALLQTFCSLSGSIFLTKESRASLLNVYAVESIIDEKHSKMATTGKLSI